VTETGEAIGNVDPRQARALVSFLRSSVPPGTIHCACKTISHQPTTSSTPAAVAAAATTFASQEVGVRFWV